MSYHKKDECYYNINDIIKRITKIENNEVSYLEYDIHVTEIKSFKKIPMNSWKHINNSFFISRDFEWEFNKEKYKTNDKPIKWEKHQFGDNKSVVFHNGKIWKASMSGTYYPRIFLERKGYVTPTREVLVEKDISKTEEFINKQNSGQNTAKWTDVRYCRNFEKIS